MDIIGMKRFDITILESYSDRSFDDAYSSFENLFSCHDHLTFSRSLPYLEIFKIKQFTVFVRMDEDKRFAFMQEHIRHFIALLKLDGFDSSSCFPHRPEITALEEQHSSMFRYDSYIIGIVNCFYA